MKKLTLAIISGLFTFSTIVNAQIYGTSTNYGGNTTYHSYNDGTSGRSTNYGGNSTYHSLDYGSSSLSGTSTNYGGNTTYHNFNSGSSSLNGTSTNYGGNTTYHSLWDQYLIILLSKKAPVIWGFFYKKTKNCSSIVN